MDSHAALAGEVFGTLFDHGELLMDLHDLLGVKVDVISEAGMRERFRKHVMREAIKL